MLFYKIHLGIQGDCKVYGVISRGSTDVGNVGDVLNGFYFQFCCWDFMLDNFKADVTSGDFFFS